jgi:hypothetical protein
LEKEIEQNSNNSGKVASSNIPAAGLTGHIGGDNLARKKFNNKVDLDNDFDTLDEPIIDTIVITYSAIYLIN